MKSKKLSLAALVAVLIAPIGGTSALAEMKIIESNVPEFRVGQRIADTDDLRLPAGGRVKVIILPAIETKIFNGPNPTQRQKYNPFGGTRGISIEKPPGN